MVTMELINTAAMVVALTMFVIGWLAVAGFAWECYKRWFK